MGSAEERLLEDAALVVDVCMSVEPDDVVTIITDDAHAGQAAAVARVVVERGGWPVVMNNETQVARGLADVRFPMAPPSNLHRAMVGADEVIIITNLEWANRFAHVSAVKETCAANGKIASVEEGMGAWDLTVEHIREATRRAKDAIAALEGKRHVRVTTARGTDFTVSIEGRPALEVTPIKERGQMMGPVPLWAEVAFAAVEDFTHGTAVVDGVMLGIGLPGQVREPIRWTLEGGRCVAIEGGEEARRLREAIAGVENADVVGEFAFGTSEKAPFGSPSEKGRIGTVHLALGDNHNAYPGGLNSSALHLDGVFLDATMQIIDDGTYILKDGRWVL
ncbi:MAG: aminopeptidase [Thermoleophilia bacterium]|nr:aminopeptidase [Thermoleophilia bacterium]